MRERCDQDEKERLHPIHKPIIAKRERKRERERACLTDHLLELAELLHKALDDLNVMSTSPRGLSYVNNISKRSLSLSLSLSLIIMNLSDYLTISFISSFIIFSKLHLSYSSYLLLSLSSYPSLAISLLLSLSCYLSLAISLSLSLSLSYSLHALLGHGDHVVELIRRHAVHNAQES